MAASSRRRSISRGCASTATDVRRGSSDLAEAETFWTEFLRSSRGADLRGVKLVISDAHEGIKAAIGKGLARLMATLPRALHA